MIRKVTANSSCSSEAPTTGIAVLPQFHLCALAGGAGRLFGESYGPRRGGRHPKVRVQVESSAAGAGHQGAAAAAGVAAPGKQATQGRHRLRIGAGCPAGQAGDSTSAGAVPVVWFRGLLPDVRWRVIWRSTRPATSSRPGSSAGRGAATAAIWNQAGVTPVWMAPSGRGGRSEAARSGGRPPAAARAAPPGPPAPARPTRRPAAMARTARRRGCRSCVAGRR